MTCPQPPSNFDSIPLPVKKVDAGSILLRSHRSDKDPIYFNRPPAGVDDVRYRFDAPAGEFGVLYCAEEFAVCFAETVLRDLPSRIPGNEDVCLPQAAITSRSVARLEVVQELRLVDFVEGLVQCRADNSITTAYPYDVPNLWSLAVHSHKDGVDGIYYRSRFTGHPAIALFDRAAPKILKRASTPMARWNELAMTLSRYRITVTPPGPSAF
ncbi:RES family NAD+ phosphorylase [Noviherbaspirillum pedocola]|uniref:RES family NAD+ phosphorylase n=1 Tax=Noviherbaspirillum pedocola TaxID=2801341 RepID=A0A934W7Z7_9BURK|nr:RES family NAD+ phosphorylase [Noviherbaspirillum pedocola]MBK4736213.1 RES family NAD+ phosphorylase [Noviherbaspirillum pedocola]